jgi:FkbM family methyltransferase
VGLDLVADISRIKDFASMQVVFDVGANVGDWTLDHLAHAPAATFYCFEPSADTFGTLRSRMESRQRVQTFHVAAGHASGTAHLHRVGSSVQHTLNAPSPEHGQAETEAVAVVSLDEFASSRGIDHIDLLKTDTEGYDLQVLAGAHGLLGRKRVDFVFVEVNFVPSDSGHSDFEAIAALLGQHGYQPVGFYDVHLWGPPWFVMYMNVLFTCV